MHPLSYLHFQMQLEGKSLNGNRLSKAAGVAPDERLPLVQVAQLRTQEIIAYYDAAMPDELQIRLAGCLHELRFPRVGPLLEILESRDLRVSAEHFITYLFPAPFPSFTDRIVTRYAADDARIQGIGFNSLEVHAFGIEQDGRVVSACASAREDEHCGEARVYTQPEYRRQGFAERVVNAWARSLINAGKIPFYSCRIDNPASLALARALTLQSVFEEINICDA